VDPVSNELRVDPVVAQHRPHRARLAMMQTLHRIERMRCLRYARVDGRPCFIERGCRVAENNAYVRFQGHFDQSLCPLLFRRKSDHPHRPRSQKLLELIGRRRTHESRILRAGELPADVRPLQVDAENARANRRVNARVRTHMSAEARHIGNSGQRIAMRCRHCGCIEAGHAVPYEESTDRCKTFRRRVHHIRAAAPMDVNVDKTGHQNAVSPVKQWAVNLSFFAQPGSDQSAIAGEREGLTRRRRHRAEDRTSRQAADAGDSRAVYLA